MNEFQEHVLRIMADPASHIASLSAKDREAVRAALDEVGRLRAELAAVLGLFPGEDPDDGTDMGVRWGRVHQHEVGWRFMVDGDALRPDLPFDPTPRAALLRAAGLAANVPAPEEP